MKHLMAILAFCILLLAGCLPDEGTIDLGDAVAVDLALSTMIDPAPLPLPEPPTPYRCPRCKDTGWITHGDGHRTPCPDCSDGSVGDYSGPLETWRDAKELVRKGNELAERSRQILDQARRDGKIRVDIQLPTPVLESQASTTQEATIRSCPSGVCTFRLPPSEPTAPSVVTQPAAPSCSSGTYCQPRGLRRWRR